MFKTPLCRQLRRSGLAALVSLAALSSAAQAAHISTPIDYAVTETGAATLSVPLQVPPGIAGMEPQLSLSYSSSSGSGLVGLGWSLIGPSTISRCARDLVNDGVRGSVNFDTDDRFCLDGQRLLLTSGSAYGADGAVYRTQRDSFVRVTSIGSYAGQGNVPNSFKVETKAGLILEFGISSNSQVPTNFGSGTQTVNRWMLQRISDRTPNQSFVEFVYCAGSVSSDGGTCTTTGWTGSTVLHYIRYTNRNATVNGESAVMFRYEDRPDTVLLYHAGSATMQKQRISAIETYREFTGAATTARGKLVKRYSLAYEPLEDAQGKSIRATAMSRLQSIIESDDQGIVLPPLTFSIASDAVFGSASIQPFTTNPNAPGAVKPPDRCGGSVGARVSQVCP